MRATLEAPQPQAPAGAARLRRATRHYEEHVIAWHALGRLSEARAARDNIARCRQRLNAHDVEPG